MSCDFKRRHYNERDGARATLRSGGRWETSGLKMKGARAKAATAPDLFTLGVPDKTRNHENTRNNTNQTDRLFRVVSCVFVVPFFVSLSFVSCSYKCPCKTFATARERRHREGAKESNALRNYILWLCPSVLCVSLWRVSSGAAVIISK